MSTPNKPTDEEREDDAMRSLVRRALSNDAIAKDSPNLLGDVQRRIRRRSRGKFFGDGWSTTQARFGYIMAAAITLLLVGLAYVALGPMDFR